MKPWIGTSVQREHQSEMSLSVMWMPPYAPIDWVRLLNRQDFHRILPKNNLARKSGFRNLRFPVWSVARVSLFQASAVYSGR